jgi:formate/nitrite transporter FocA (FNT family)
MSKNPGQRANRTATTKKEAHAIEDRSRLRTPIVYEILRQEGEEEMSRPFVSLWWSGIAAGLSISFSLLAQSLLSWRCPICRGGGSSPASATASGS